MPKDYKLIKNYTLVRKKIKIKIYKNKFNICVNTMGEIIMQDDDDDKKI